jgi:glycosyltransferase involved in cell wall biosynthesis
VKLAIVVQRYGAEINGGAEQHARYVAEHLAGRHDVEVITTCATDYVTWDNALPAGEALVNGVRVRRFPVVRPRVPVEFARRSRLVFDEPHSVGDELAWLESEGPASPALVKHVAGAGPRFDYFLFFSYRYYHAYHGARAVPSRAILVPTAERDAAIGLAIFRPVLRGVRALMYNSFEERAMIQAASGNQEVPGVVVGIGSDVPPDPEPARFRKRFGIHGPYVVYVGRVDENKGCPELFTYFERYAHWRRSGLTLVLVGHSILPIPAHPRIRHLGFLPDRDKFDGIAGADALIMPSRYESLSMVALEAWALGRPVLANGRCDVLRGQCLRSNAGLYYDDFDEFGEALRVIETNPGLRTALGANGHEYFRRHYAWPVIERKYDDLIAQLAADDRAGLEVPPLEPLPGWFARRRRELPPAAEVLSRLPSGAAGEPARAPERAPAPARSRRRGA